MLQTCPQCHNRVLFDATGVCPVCQFPIAPEAISGPSPGELADRAEKQAIVDFRQRLIHLTPHLFVAPLILVANVAVFAAMAVGAGIGLGTPDARVLLEWGANFGPFATGDQWWRLLTAMFVHVGPVHLGFNMWALWSLGRLTERFLGNAGLAIVYVVSGLAASVTSLLWNSGAVSAGASGAVFGLLGGLMGFLVCRHDSAPRSLRAELQRVGVNFVVCNAAIALIPGIDWAAHVGGLIAGFGCGAILSQPMDRVTARRRAVRNAVMLIVGLAVVGLAFAAARQRPLDRRGMMVLLGLTEEPVIEAYNKLRGRWREHEISGPRFAELLEREVLPPWKRTQERFTQLNRVREEDRRLLSLCRDYLHARTAAWEAEARFARTEDPEALVELNRRVEAGETLFQQLRRQLEQ